LPTLARTVPSGPLGAVLYKGSVAMPPIRHFTELPHRDPLLAQEEANLHR